MMMPMHSAAGMLCFGPKIPYLPVCLTPFQVGDYFGADRIVCMNILISDDQMTGYTWRHLTTRQGFKVMIVMRNRKQSTYVHTQCLV